MRFGHDQLRDKALHALEEAVQEARFRSPRRCFALRFALAYLWAYGGGPRAPYDELWRALGRPKTPWSFSACDRALDEIHRALKIPRDEARSSALWARWRGESGG